MRWPAPAASTSRNARSVRPLPSRKGWMAFSSETCPAARAANCSRARPRPFAGSNGGKAPAQFAADEFRSAEPARSSCKLDRAILAGPCIDRFEDVAVKTAISVGSQRNIGGQVFHPVGRHDALEGLQLALSADVLLVDENVGARIDVGVAAHSAACALAAARRARLHAISRASRSCIGRCWWSNCSKRASSSAVRRSPSHAREARTAGRRRRTSAISVGLRRRGSGIRPSLSVRKHST